MFGFIKNLFGISTKTPARRSPAKSLNARLGVERLENREVMSVTPHGGVILPHVELQSVYLGSEWSQNSTYHNQTGQLERFGGTLVNSSYMDMLTQAGYQVGRGSASQGLILNYNYNFNYYLTDSTIRSELQTSIRAGQLQQPDANRLYVIYVEPNVAIMNDHDHNSTSQKDFTGYHSAFAGMDRFGHSIDIHYAVVAYPGGSVRNITVFGQTGLNGITMTASHEIAEAVTDPNVNYKKLGWYDVQNNGEVGDINRHLAQFQGFVVQTIINKNDQAMYPAGSHIIS